MNAALLALAMQRDSDEGGGCIRGVVGLAVMVVMIASWWKLFTKAGEPGWACIVPIYNLIVLLRIAGRPWWWFILMLLPVIQIIFAIIVALDLAKAFGKGVGFAVGMILLPIVFYPLLAFGDARYGGGKAA